MENMMQSYRGGIVSYLNPWFFYAFPLFFGDEMIIYIYL